MRTVGLLLLLGVAWPGQAQPPPAFERIDSRDGLPHNTVHALLLDGRGFLWIGTADGLARYDGRRFEVFRRRPGEPGTLPSNTIQALAEAADGSLWVGTAAGACRLDGEATGRFFCPGPRLDVLRLMADRETVWATAVGSAWRLGGAGIFEHVPVPGFDADSQWIEVSVRDGRSVAVLGERGGDSVQRYRFEGGRFVGSHSRRLPESTVSLLTDDGEIVSVPEVAGAVGWGSLGSARAVRDGGVLWIGAEGGLLRSEDGRLGAVPLGEAGSLGSAVLTLATGGGASIWVGTQDGLWVHDPRRRRFAHLDPAASGAARPVMAVDTDKTGALWIGTLGGGLIRRRPGRSPEAIRLGGRLADRVWVLHATEADLWVGTDGGLCRLDPAAARPEAACLRDPLARSDGKAYVYVLADDGAGGLWSGGTSLVRLDARGAVVRRVRLETAGVENAVTILHRDRRGRLWVGIEKRGLWRLDTPDAPLERVRLGDLDQASVWAIHEAADGTVWLGTADGLFRLGEGGRIEPHAADLPASTVYGIAPVGDDLWLATPRGIARYRPEARALVVYGEDDGVRTVEFNRRAVHRAPDGRLHLGGIGGLTSFDPEAFDGAAAPPPTFVTGVRASSARGETALDASGTLRLGPEVQAVAVEVAAPAPSGARGLRYAYRLDPLGDTWVEVDEPVIRLAGVPPGRYTFRARASRGDGVWGDAAALPLVLRPPWYATFWFRIVALAAGLALAAGAVQIRIRAVRREERMRWRIASDLHDDIGSGLSSVALLAERVRDRAPLAETEARQLTSVSRAARSMVESLREIVWFVDPAHERPGAFAARARETATALLGARVIVEAPARLRLDAAPLSVRRDVFLILKEALHNAARHAPEAAVRVSIAEAAGDIILAVTDDGPGFDPASETPGTGLRSLRQRAEALRGQIDVQSTPGHGTTVTLRAPLP
ncbi:MAG: two-component regulator propeller domain-containing protein [Bacteroidota bacterium]